MNKNKLKKQQQRQQQEKRLQQRLQQQHSTSGEKGGRVGGALNLATPRKNRPSLSLARSGMSGMSGMDPENDSDVVFDELPEVEQDAYLRHKILSHVNKLKRLAHPGFSGQQSMLRCKNNFFFFGWLFPVHSTIVFLFFFVFRFRRHPRIGSSVVVGGRRTRGWYQQSRGL
jgi:hypothetical protein